MEELTMTYEQAVAFLKKYMEENGRKQVEVAAELGVSGGLVSSFLAGTYKTPHAIIPKVQELAKIHEKKAVTPKEPDFVETSVSRTVTNAIAYAHLRGTVAVVYGDAGVGKTFAVREYMKRNSLALGITISPTYASVTGVNELIAEQLGVRERGDRKITREIVAKLRNSGRVLVIDEAQHLTVRALNHLRCVSDESGIGIALVGNEEIYSKLRGSGKADFAQLFSRVGMRKQVLTNSLTAEDIIPAIARRHVFPCWFGVALQRENAGGLQGVDELLAGLDEYTRAAPALEAFGARVFKVSQDERGERLTWLRVTGGELKVKAQLTGEADGEPWAEKANQLRLYSGAKYTLAEAIGPGQVCAVTGLTRAKPGTGLGAERDSDLPVLEPVLSYRVCLPEGADVHAALGKLHRLEEEEPQLHVVWNETLGEIHVQLMGEIQLEVLKSLLAERYGLDVEFDSGGILYKETITEAIEGVGHYEPLRHYAEVHLKLEPLPRGSGMQFAVNCREEELDKNWQRLVLTHLEEKQHLGVLIGAPLTDMKITLIAGRAHLKHTEGGDFRQATYRAVRQGLMMANQIKKTQLLEPWYSFRLEVPEENIGRAMSDVQRMEGSFDPPETAPDGQTATLTGFAPVAAMRSYPMEVVSYTRGRGHLNLTLDGYRPCHNAAEVIEAVDYEPEHDLDNPADSVFCSHGAGFVVPWEQVRSHMHVDSGWGHTAPTAEETAARPRRMAAYRATLEEDAELLKIFERTYGPIKRDPLAAFRPVQKRERPDFAAEQWEIAPEYLLVDGYNIIFAWDELNALSKESLDAARHRLMDILCNYQGFKKCVLILVFDAYRVPGSPGSIEQYHNIHVVYTKEAETADMFIERVTHEIGKNRRVRVATSDGMEQVIILGHGALRVSARMFHEEVQDVEKEIRRCIQGEA